MDTIDSIPVDERLKVARQVIGALREAQAMPYKELTPSRLPDEAGIYLITTTAGEVIRGGGRDSLARRLYSNHLMGSQSDNLPQQLVRDGTCQDQAAAKVWIRTNCEVRVLTIDALRPLDIDLSCAEHFLLAVFRPKYRDDSGRH